MILRKSIEISSLIGDINLNRTLAKVFLTPSKAHMVILNRITYHPRNKYNTSCSIFNLLFQSFIIFAMHILQMDATAKKLHCRIKLISDEDKSMISVLKTAFMPLENMVFGKISSRYYKKWKNNPTIPFCV